MCLEYTAARTEYTAARTEYTAARTEYDIFLENWFCEKRRRKKKETWRTFRGCTPVKTKNT
jgi:hypothetical protein